jgi:predicted dehydrogenase
LSSTPEKARRSGAALGLDPDHVYDDYETMATKEAARADGVEAVAIVTPNHRHAGPAIAFLRAGARVICDKPLALDLEEARAIEVEARRSGRIFALTHNYSGYPLVRHMRERIAAGDLAEIRTVQAEYARDWLAAYVDPESNKQAAWRRDPARSGAGGALGDIGTHAFQLADYVNSLEVAEISAELTSFGAGRVLDDNAQVGMRYASGARGSIWVGQSLRATAMACGRGSMEPRAGSTGARKNRTRFCGRGSHNQPASLRVAAPTLEAQLFESPAPGRPSRRLSRSLRHDLL